MSDWYRELISDPGPLGAWAERLLSSEPPDPAIGVAREDWPWASEESTAYLDQCRALRTSLLARDPAPAIVLMASPEPQAGVSRLARALAPLWTVTAGRSCLLLSVTEASERPGLSDLLAEDLPLETSLRQATLHHGLHWMNGGLSSVPLADLLAGPAWTSTLDQARARFDVTLIDGAPASAGAVFDQLAAAADAVVLVVRTGCTSHQGLLAAQRRIPPGKLAGVVLND